MRYKESLGFGFFRKKEVKHQVVCSACRRDLSEGNKSGKTLTFCDQNDPKKPVYFFHPECVSETDIAEAVSTRTIHEKGWTPQPY